MESGLRARRAVVTVAAAAMSCGLLMAPQAWAVSPYFEDFETGSDGWTQWPGATGQLNLDTSHNHTPAGQTAYRASEGVPGGFASYTTIPDGTGLIRADVYVFADNANPDVDDARFMLQLTQGANFSTDYLQLGVLQDYAGGSEEFSVRTRHRDSVQGNGTFDTNVPRPQINGWVKLSIEADAGVGGDVRFYVDDALVYNGVGERMGADLNTIRLGVNFGNNLDTFWYDDVSITPEPASLGLLGLAAVGLMRRRRRSV